MIQNLFKHFSILILISFIGCSKGDKANILEGSCPEHLDQGIPITDTDGITEMCLTIDIEQKVIAWNWSEDGSMFATALHDVSKTPVPAGGRLGYSPPATNWYISNRDGSNLQRFPLADNKSLRFSPDAKYAIIRDKCIDISCWFSVYDIQEQRIICSYKQYTVWFNETDCGPLTYKNGDTWDLRGEVNDEGCEFYDSQGLSIPACAAATPESYPAPGNVSPHTSGYPPLSGNYIQAPEYSYP
jgi:hypothetical protein